MIHHLRAQTRNRRRNASGFTLIELLVAVSIWALTAMASWRGIDMVIRTNSRIEAREQSVESIDKAFSQLDADMSNLPKFAETVTSSETGTQPHSLVFVRSLNSASELNTQYQVVAYTIENSILYRVTSPEVSQSRDLEKIINDFQAYVPGSIENSNYYEVALTKDIEKFTISYFCGQFWTNRSSCAEENIEESANQDKKSRKPNAVLFVLHTLKNGIYNKISIIQL